MLTCRRLGSKALSLPRTFHLLPVLLQRCLRLANKKPHSKVAQKVDGSTSVVRGRGRENKRIDDGHGTKLVRCSTCLILERGEVSIPGGAGFSFLLLLRLVGDVAPQHKLHHFFAHVGISLAPTGVGRRRSTP